MNAMDARLNALRQKMTEMNLDAIYVNSAENHLYMSGFDNPDGHLVITREKAYVFADFRYIEAAKAEAMAIKETYEKNMAESKAKADDLLMNAQRTANARSEEIIMDAQRAAVQIKQKAEADIAQEKKKAINDAKNEISEMALAIAGKVVGRELNEADQSNLIDSFIDGLGDEV